MRLSAAGSTDFDSMRVTRVDSNRLRRAVAVRTAVSVSTPIRTA